jgi:hypothetical protein
MEDVDDLGSPNRRDSPRSLRNWKAAAGAWVACVTGKEGGVKEPTAT